MAAIERFNLQTLFRAGALAVALAFGLGVAACGDDPPPDPTADLRFFHASSTLGTIDVTIDGRTFSISPASLSPAIKVPPGTVTISVANSGAQQALFSLEENLAEGPHVFVVAGDQSDSSLGAFEVGLDRPVLEQGQAAFQVFSVVSADLTLDVYGADATTPDSVSRFTQSEFVVSEPADASLRVYNAGDNPGSAVPLINLDAQELGLRAGGIHLVLVSGDLTGLDHVVTRLN